MLYPGVRVDVHVRRLIAIKLREIKKLSVLIEEWVDGRSKVYPDHVIQCDNYAHM